MTINVGETLPEANLHLMGADDPEEVAVSALTKGRKVVIFGLPGAFTSTCTTAHVPSFMRTYEQFRARGVDDVICVSVNDAYVMDAWGKSTGATAKGLLFLADPACAFTTAIGLDYDSPKTGLYRRSRRYSMYVEDGVVKVMNREQQRGTCETSGGEALLDDI